MNKLIMKELKATNILSSKNVLDFKKYISLKYANLTPSQKANILADAIRKTIGERVPKVEKSVKINLIDNLLKTSVKQGSFDINSEDVFIECINLGHNINEDAFLPALSSWINEIAVAKIKEEEIQKFIHKVYNLDAKEYSVESINMVLDTFQEKYSDISDNVILDNDISDSDISDNGILGNDISDNVILDNDILDSDISDNVILDNDILDSDISDNVILNSDILDNDILDNCISDNDTSDNVILDNDILNNDISNDNTPDSYSKCEKISEKAENYKFNIKIADFVPKLIKTLYESTLVFLYKIKRLSLKNIAIVIPIIILIFSIKIFGINYISGSNTNSSKNDQQSIAQVIPSQAVLDIQNQFINTNISISKDTKGEIKTLKSGEKLVMKATAYDLSIESCGKARNHPLYGITATGTKATIGRTVAVDPLVIPLGSKLHIEFPESYNNLDGIYIAEDTGSKVKGNIIDIFLGEDKTGEAIVHKKADNFGIQWVEVSLIN